MNLRNQKGRGIYFLLFCAWLTLCTYFVIDHRQTAASEDRTALEEIIGNYRFTYRNFENSYDLFFKSAIDKRDIKQLLINAANNPKSKDALRKELYGRLFDGFANLRKAGFNNTVFAMPDGSVFLRMNNPSLYGDGIDDKRVLVKKIKDGALYANGFEVGKTVAGFTFCHPLILDGKLAGIAFSTVSAQDFVKMMNSDLRGKFVFIIEKNKIDRVMLEEYKKNYPESYMSDRFYRDGSFDSSYVGDADFKEDFRRQTKDVDLSDYKPKRVHVRISGSPAVASLIPIEMSDGGYGAYLGHYGDGLDSQRMTNELLIKLAVTTIFSTWLLFGFIRRQKLDEELRNSEAEYRMLFEQAAVGFCYIDQSGRILKANDKLCKIFGYSMEELLNMRFQDVSHPEELESEKKSFLALLKDKNLIHNHRYQYLKKDGSYLWTNVFARSFDRGGKLGRAIIATVEDISDKLEAERRLERQSIQMLSILNGIPSMIFIKNAKHQWVFGNKTFCDFIGQSFENLYGKSDEDFLPKEEVKKIYEDDDKVINGGTLIQYEEQVTNANGEARIFMTSKSPFRLLDGEVGLLAIATDITENKFAKQNLERWGMAFNAIKDPIFLHDKECRIIEANKAYIEKAGIDRKLIIGRPYWDVFPKSDGPLHTCIATLNGDRMDGEEEFASGTGEIFLIRNLGITDENGHHKFSMHIIEDITEHHEAIHTSTMLKKLFDNTAESMLVTDKEGVILSVNKAFTKITGYAQDEAVGKKPNILRSGLYDESFYKEMWGTILKDGKWEGEIYNKRKNGELYPEWLTITSIRNDKNEFENFIAIALDLTQIYKDKQTIEEQSQMILAQSRFAAMGELIGMIAHQWRQPITAIGMGANNMLIDIELDDVKNDVFKKHLESINTQVHFLSNTIDDFRNFFKPQTKSTIVSISKLIDQAVKIIGKSLESHNIALNMDIACGGMCDDGACSLGVCVHEGELVQTLLVFLGNAKDALIEKNIESPVITIGCPSKTDDDFVEITVKDNAGGVPQDISHKIFEPYFTTKNAKNGTGLGLYIAKTIVEKYQGGSIGMRNENGGACFWIRLPLAK